MEIIKLPEIKKKKIQEKIISLIKSGKIFIYPTDTVYGLGCNALNQKAVQRIREIKKSNQSFSVIAPSKQWITKNFVIKFPEYLEKLPGPYTLILKMKKQIVPEIVSKNTLGIRIPKHTFTKIIQKSGLPFVTTSCNVHGHRPISEIKESPKEVFKKVDTIIDAGKLDSPASKVIDLTGKRPKILRK